MPADVEPTWLSLLPALVTIVLAFATRQVLVALFAGILTGALVLYAQTGMPSDLNFIHRFLLPALGSEGYARILLIYLWSLGGLIGLWEKTGGARHFAESVGGRLARGPRSALLFSWVLGCVFHQGGTVSTVLTGTTVKPVADRHRVSHEELAYVVDSTASPIATILPFNAWPAYVAGLVAGTIELLPDTRAGIGFFVASLRFNFYGMFAVVATLLFALDLLPWVGGTMARARDRARASGALDAPNAEPLLPAPPEVHAHTRGYAPSLLDFAVPIGVLLGVAVLPYLLFRSNWIDEAFIGCALSAMLVAKARGMRLADVLDGFVRGCQSMTIGAIILGLAVTLGYVAKELDTAQYLVTSIGGLVPAAALPALLTAVCMGIAFATGTSWGTYAVVFPVAIPLAFALNPDPIYIQICFGAILGGAVFGDQASPISDTTILSSMFTGCDLMDHVKTQLPLALAAAGLGAVLSTAMVALNG
ncbi:MAG: sodium:proton antiporter [Deltaproteobacteria bacterium]|nr:MAG: sodium:proton antiporter [Deltaproteobacteria bacterium]